ARLRSLARLGRRRYDGSIKDSRFHVGQCCPPYLRLLPEWLENEMSERALPSVGASTSRRGFLKQGTAAALAGSALTNLVLPASVHAAGSDVLKIGLLGCGGRGTGAATNALAADPNVKMVALGDAFADQVDRTLNLLLASPQKEKVAVPADQKFAGF